MELLRKMLEVTMTRGAQSAGLVAALARPPAPDGRTRDCEGASAPGAVAAPTGAQLDPGNKV